ncbi:MAG: DMT family transporter [Saprospiraceae bacterium]|nr:DMT family transporter [Saprospiraceae bacterium]
MLSRLSAHQIGVFAVVISALLWSTGGLFIKLLPFEPMTILFYRSVCAAVLFGVLFHKSLLKINGLTLLISLFYVGLMTTFVFATKMTTAANAIFLQYTAPIYVLLLEPLLFRIPLERINIATIIVCFLGMALFFLGDLELGDMLANIISLASGILLAALMLGQRKNDPAHHETAIFWGNIIMLLIAMPSYAQSPSPTLEQWLMLLFLGFVQIGLGYLFFTYGLKRVLAIEGSLLAMLEPILNPVWVFLGYGETPSKFAILGGMIIVAMLAIRTIIVERKRYKQYKAISNLK